jgi:hypothetical protein
MDQSIDYHKLYLADMLAPDHPEFERVKEAMKDSPEGKRVELFRSENLKYQDGLESKTPNQLDQIIAAESVEFHGDNLDRISKIRAIRKMRGLTEKEKMRGMTKAEREKYLETKDENVAKNFSRSVQQNLDHDAEIQLRQEEKQRKQTAMEEMRLKRAIERDAMKDAGRQYLDEEAARRAPVNPSALKQAAAEELAKEEAVDAPVEAGEEETVLEDKSSIASETLPETKETEEDTPVKKSKKSRK